MNEKQKSVFIWVEIVLLAICAFFKFALIGYGTLALVFAVLAVLYAAFCFLRVLALEHKTASQVIKRLLIALIAIGAGIFIIAEANVIGEAHTDDDPEAPHLLVLGAGVNGTQPSLSLLNRLEAAKDYLDTYPNSVAIVSGGQGPGEDISEAECMRTWLESAGIDPDRIISEDKATTTQENIAYSLTIISGRGDDPEGKLAIVSSEYHLFRAKRMAEDLGAQALGVAAKTTYPVLRINYFIREGLAVIYLWFFGDR